MNTTENVTGSLILLFLAFVNFQPAWANGACFPIQRIKAGYEFSGDKTSLINIVPTEFCFEQQWDQAGRENLLLSFKHEGQLLVSMTRAQTSDNPINISPTGLSTYIERVSVHAGSHPRHFTPENYYLWVEFSLGEKPKTPKSGKEIADKILEHFQFAGREVIGELKLGSEVFAILRNDDWGSRDYPKKPVPPMTPEPQPDIDCDYVLRTPALLGK